MNLDVKTYSLGRQARCFVLQDVVSLEFTILALGGFQTATVDLARQPGLPYLELGFNYHVQISDKSGFTCWEGRIYSLPSTSSSGSDTYQFQAFGYNANLADLTSIWSPYYPNPTDLATIILEGINGTVARNGFPAMAAGANAIVADTTGVPLTGRLLVYTPGTATSVREHLDELISKYGNSLNTTLYWQVLEGRRFYLTSRPATTQPIYSTGLALADSYQAGFNADNYYNRVSVKYQTYYDQLITTRDNTTAQALYGSTFGSADPAASFVPYIREPAIVDITSHGQVDVSQANAVGDTLLARYSNEGLRIAATSATFTDTSSITYESSGQKVPLCRVRPATFILWKDLAVTNPVYQNFQSVMFIGQVKYSANDNGETLELTSEDARPAENILAAMMMALDQSQSMAA